MVWGGRLGAVGLVVSLCCGLLLSGCGDSEGGGTSSSGTSDPVAVSAPLTTAPPTTTAPTTVAPTAGSTIAPTSAAEITPEVEANIAVAEAYFAAGEKWRDYVVSEGRLRYAENRMSSLTGPPLLETPDWDGDGLSEGEDVIEEINVVRRRLGTTYDVTCDASEQYAPYPGPEVLCTVEEHGVFTDRAGVTWIWTQVFVFEDGLISEIALPQDDDAVPEAVIRQFDAFEQWVHDTHPDQYSKVFLGPCCPGSGWIYEPGTVDTLAVLIGEWAET